MLYWRYRNEGFDMKIGFLFQLEALWIGVHYSPYCKRYCINFLPFLTVWVMMVGGKEPHKTR